MAKATKQPPVEVSIPKRVNSYVARIPDDIELDLFPDIRNPLQRAFLAAFVECMRDSGAAEAAEISNRVVLYWKKNDILFQEAYKEAVRMGVQKFEDAATQRAVEGYQRPVYQMGMLVGHETVYSDKLLELKLKAYRPDLYGAKPVEIKGEIIKRIIGVDIDEL